MKSTLFERFITKTWSDRRQHLIPWFTVVLLVVTYVILFPWLVRNFGIYGRVFSLSYIFFAAWFWGIRGGTIAGILHVPFALLLNKAFNVELPLFPLGPIISISFGALFGLLRDITLRLQKQLLDHEKIEKELRDSENRLQFALEGAKDGAWDYFPQTGEVYFSPVWFSMLDYEVDELPHTFETWTGLLHPEDKPRAEKRVQDFLENHEREYAIEIRMRTKGGVWKWVLTRGKAVQWDSDGNTTRMVGTHTDISDRKKAEEELKKHRDHLEELISERTYDLQKTNENLRKEIAERKRVEEALWESKENYRDLVESANSIILRWSIEGNITYINPFGRDFFGYNSDELLGRNVLGTIVPETESTTKRDLSLLIEDIKKNPDAFKNNENENMRKDGTRVWVSWTNRTVMDKNGNPVEILSIGNDITEKRKLEAQLQQAQKMEAIGTLAGGVAHDLNNIFAGVVSYPDLLLLQLPEESPLRKPVKTIKKSGEKAAAIVQDLLTLARRGVEVLEVVDLNTIIQEYRKSPEYEKMKSFHPGINIQVNLENDLSNIEGSPVHLTTAVMNLVSNAAEAIYDRGRVSISTENCYIEELIDGNDRVERKNYVVLKVSDTGAGISKENLDRIFEPFFTKKKMGRSGTGLGMAVVWGTVKDHNGFIDVNSTLGEGTTFSIYFPATKKKQSEQKTSLDVENYMGNGESILVIDDVEEQREIAFSILSELGYSVTAVSSGEDAFDYLKAHSVDLLILDMIMDPGMDGLATYKKILELHPGQKAIAASGFSETDRVKEVRRLGVGQYIKKPYTLETIGLAAKKELEK